MAQAVTPASVNVKVAEALKGMYSNNKGVAQQGGIAFSGVAFAVLFLTTSVLGYIAVQSNLNNKCNDNTVGVKIATNRSSRIFMIVMMVFTILMIVGAFAGIGLRFR